MSKKMNKLARRGVTALLASATAFGMVAAPVAPTIGTAVTAMAADVTNATDFTETVQNNGTEKVSANKFSADVAGNYFIVKEAGSSTKINITDSSAKDLKDAIGNTVTEGAGKAVNLAVGTYTVSFTVDATASKTDKASFTVYRLDGTDAKKVASYAVNATDGVSIDTSVMTGVAKDTLDLVSGADTELSLKGALKDGTGQAFENSTYTISASDNSKLYVGYDGKAQAATLKGLSEGTVDLTITGESKKTDGTAYTATKTIKVNITKLQTNGIKKITVKKAADKETSTLYENGDWKTADKKGTLALNSKSGNTTAQLEVETLGAKAEFASSNTSVASVSADGLITATGNGTTSITITSAKNDAVASDSKVELQVTVTDGANSLTIKDASGKEVATASNKVDADKATPVALDVASSTAATAQKSYQINASAVLGGDVHYAIFSDITEDANKGISGTPVSASVAQINGTGLVTTGKDAGTFYVVVTSTKQGDAASDTKIIKFTTVSTPESTLAVDKDTVQLDVTNEKEETVTATPQATNAVTSVVGATTMEGLDTATGVDSIKNIVTVNQTGNKYILTAKEEGTVFLKITEAATSTTRETSKVVKVVVTKDQLKDNKVALTSNKKVSLKAGETAKIEASADSKTDISYLPDDTSIVTVSDDGTITAVAPGTAIITVSAASGNGYKAASSAVVVTVQKEEKVTPAVKKPGKVKNVKVANKKGNKLKVSYDKVKGASNYLIKYTVKTKKGKKTISKTYTLRTIKTAKTISQGIQKGATVSVKVRAYTYDHAKDKNLFGSYSKIVKKTVDKK